MCYSLAASPHPGVHIHISHCMLCGINASNRGNSVWKSPFRMYIINACIHTQTHTQCITGDVHKVLHTAGRTRECAREGEMRTIRGAARVWALFSKHLWPGMSCASAFYATHWRLLCACVCACLCVSQETRRHTQSSFISGHPRARSHTHTHRTLGVLSMSRHAAYSH